MRQQTKSLVLLFVVFSGYIVNAQNNQTNFTTTDCTCQCTCNIPISTTSSGGNTGGSTGGNTGNSTNTTGNTGNSTSTTGNTGNNTSTTGNTGNSTSNGKIQKIAYVNGMASYWGPSIITDSFGLNSCYDVIILTFWLSKTGGVDAVGLYQNIYTNLGTDTYGKSNAEVQKTIRDLFHAKGKKLFISAFGDSDMPTSQKPEDVANNLADWVGKNPYIDGIDIDYEDNAAVLSGPGITWLIAFQKQLSLRLGKNYLFSHAPQAPYFSRTYYNDGGYYRLNNEVGNLIDWYNVQFYNQGTTNSYDSFEKIFLTSGAPFVGTSYQEIIQNDSIPISKLVLGKPTTTKDASNTGYVNPSDLGKFVQQAQTQLGYKIPGFFIWQLNSDDKNCGYPNAFQLGLNSILTTNSNNSTNTNNNSTNTNNNNNNSTNTNTNNNSTNTNNNSTNTNSNSTNTNSNSTNTNNNTNTRGQILSMVYVNKITTWWGPQVLGAFGLNSCYDVIILTFWLSTSTGAADAVLVYKNIYDYLGTDQYGKNSLEVQKTLQGMLQQKGKKLLISAFGDTDYPTSKDATLVATNLANFANSLPYIDGIDLDYEDNAAIVDGTGVAWLITFTKVLRSKLTNKSLILTHAPQAPYFSQEYYASGAYYKIHQEVGNLIDWYNVQFYNQGTNSYDTYDKLFIQSGQWFYGTAYKEIIEKAGVPLNKIVLGKPATTSDVYNTGYTDPKTLGQLAKRAQTELGYTIPGFFIWQLSSDSNCAYKTAFFQGFNA